MNRIPRRGLGMTKGFPGDPMKYLCLICAETLMEGMPAGFAAQHFEAYRAFTKEIRDSGHFVACKPAAAAR